MILRVLAAVLLVATGVIAAGTAFIVSGTYDVAADTPHTPAVHALLTSLRDRSIARRTRGLKIPDLEDAELIRNGSGNYDAMCSGCHLAPGVPETELSKGLYPAPPPLAKAGIVDPPRAFWVIKRGIKATGMPAWGKSMEDEHIWGMVAFLVKLPEFDQNAYRTLVASSAGHSHGGRDADRDAASTHQHEDGSTHAHLPYTDRPQKATDPMR